MKLANIQLKLKSKKLSGSTCLNSIQIVETYFPNLNNEVPHRKRHSCTDAKLMKNIDHKSNDSSMYLVNRHIDFST